MLPEINVRAKVRAADPPVDTPPPINVDAKVRRTGVAHNGAVVAIDSDRADGCRDSLNEGTRRAIDIDGGGQCWCLTECH